jgi:hypothetical protein
LLLDCCFSGAFTKGMLARGGQALDVMERFEGRGRAVLTAYGALEYAWEGNDLTQLNEPSVFTSAVVHGLRSGEADRDGDQLISVDELYDYVYEAVRSRTPSQTPGKWSDVEGTLVLARSLGRALPGDLQAALEDERSWVRVAAVGQLAALRHRSDPALAAAAGRGLQRLAQDPSRDVAVAAEQAVLDSQQEAPTAQSDRVVHGAAASQAQKETRHPLLAPPSWMPALVVAGGWIAGWVLSLALATSAWVDNLPTGVALALVGWIIVAPLVAAGLRWGTPGVAPRRAALVGLGWPICMAFGLGAPTTLRLSAEGAGLLGLAVAVAGLLAAVALVPSTEPIPWDRVLVVAAGWSAGWLWSGATAWPHAFFLLSRDYTPTLSGVFDSVPSVQLTAGGVLSGIVGGVLMWLLVRRAPEGMRR